MRIENPEDDKWYDVPGFEGVYQTKVDGTLRKVYENRPPHFLKQDEKERYCMRLYYGNRYLSVSQILYMTFVGDVPEKCVVRHTGNKATLQSIYAVRRGSGKIEVAKIDKDGNVLDVYSSLAEAGEDNFYCVPVLSRWIGGDRKRMLNKNGIAFARNTKKALEEARKRIKREREERNGKLFDDRRSEDRVDERTAETD